jgi:putative phosphoribosyl transferase
MLLSTLWRSDQISARLRTREEQAMFLDRTDAGRRLAEALQRRADPDPVVLALPRGGVPVAAEVARMLKAPLDLVMVRKIGVPHQPELAVGAVANGDRPEIVVNEDVARHTGLSRAEIEEMAVPQIEEIRRRRALYLAGRAAVPVAGRAAIVVDDGVATGATMRAALRAVRRQAPALVVLAVPVASREALEGLRDEADAVVCLEVPDPFFAVGVHYRHFGQTSDDEVVKLLRAAI